VASNQLLVGVGTFEVEVGSTHMVPIMVMSNYILADPASLTLVLRDPASNLFTFTYPVGATLISRNSVGSYVFTFSPSDTGRHVYTITSTTPNLVSSGEFQVIKQGVT
jgi:hypothetical protein